MKKRNLIWVCVLVFLMSFLTGCGCQHEWAEADCLTAKTCIHCGKTEGEPLGHDWQEATCTAPKTCSRCEETEGTALPHVSGEVTETLDVVTAVVLSETHCKNCDSVLESRSTSLDSFLTEDGTYLLTPNQFLERLSGLSKSDYPDFSYTLTDRENADQPCTMVILSWGDDENDTQLFFNHTDTRIFHQSEFDEAEIYCISFVAAGTLTDIEDLLINPFLKEDMLYILGKTADPLFDVDDLRLMKAMKFVSCLNALEEGEIYGYWVNHDMLYQFIHLILSDEPPATVAESVLIYAVDELDSY